MNQRQRILRHLETFGSITALEAMQEYGIMRLAARIADLEKEGYRLKHERIGSINRFGEKVYFTKYTLIKTLPKGEEIKHE